MKKFAILTMAGLILSLTVLPALAISQPDTGVDLATIVGLGTKDLREGVMSIINTLMGFLGIVAIIIFLWGGFRWMTAGGSEEKIDESKKIITAGIIGLIIVFVSYALAAFVINQLITATGANY